jgi:hypothetical protein
LNAPRPGISAFVFGSALFDCRGRLSPAASLCRRNPLCPQGRPCGAAVPHIIPIVTTGARSSRRNDMAQSPQRRTRVMPHISAAEISVKCGNVEAAHVSWPNQRSRGRSSMVRPGKVGVRSQPDSRNLRVMNLRALLTPGRVVAQGDRRSSPLAGARGRGADRATYGEKG